MMMSQSNDNWLRGVVVLCVLGTTIAYGGEYVPKSYYFIDSVGHQSDIVYLRSKRSTDIFDVLRLKRGSSYSSSSSSASSSSSSSSGGAPIYFGGQENVPNHAYSNVDSNTYNTGGSGGHPGGAQSFASASSSSYSGGGGGRGGYGHPGGEVPQYDNGPGPQLFSRFGEGIGDSIKAGASVSGEKGAFSSSSTSVDGNGKVTYSIKTGKY